MTHDEDPWLDGEDAAALAGVSWSYWRKAMAPGELKGNPVPKTGRGVRVDPDTRRRQWRRSLVLAWAEARPGSPGRPRDGASPT